VVDVFPDFARPPPMMAVLAHSHRIKTYRPFKSQAGAALFSPAVFHFPASRFGRPRPFLGRPASEGRAFFLFQDTVLFVLTLLQHFFTPFSFFPGFYPGKPSEPLQCSRFAFLVHIRLNAPFWVQRICSSQRRSFPFSSHAPLKDCMPLKATPQQLKQFFAFLGWRLFNGIMGSPADLSLSFLPHSEGRVHSKLPYFARSPPTHLPHSHFPIYGSPFWV